METVISNAMQFFREVILPNLKDIAVVFIIVLLLLTVLRIVIPVIWKNFLVGIIKISEKNNNKKEDE